MSSSALKFSSSFGASQTRRTASTLNKNIDAHKYDYQAIDSLLRLLSDENMQSASPRLETPRDIKALYLSAKHRKQIDKFSPEQFSTLICFFGSVSILSSPGLPISSIPKDNLYGTFRFAPEFIKRFPSASRTHWAFVQAIAKDKRNHGHALSESDNFWLMCAALEEAIGLAKLQAADCASHFVANDV